MALTSGELGNILVKADAIAADALLKRHTTANIEAAKAIIEQQTARLDFVSGSSGRKVKVNWLESCQPEEVDCTTSCTIGTANTVDVKGSIYSLDTCKQAAFKVALSDYDSNLYSYQEAVASKLNATMAALDNFLASSVVSALISGRGIHVYKPSQYTMTALDALATVAPANWTASIIPHLAISAKMAGMNNPFILSGKNMYVDMFSASIACQTCDSSKGNIGLYNQMPMYFDLNNIDAVNANRTFLIERGAVAILNAVDFTRQPTSRIANQMTFSRRSNNLPGIQYDVMHEVICDSGIYYHAYKVIARFDVAIMPVACSTEYTGVLQFA